MPERITRRRFVIGAASVALDMTVAACVGRPTPTPTPKPTDVPKPTVVPIPTAVTEAQTTTPTITPAVKVEAPKPPPTPYPGQWLAETDTRFTTTDRLKPEFWQPIRDRIALHVVNGGVVKITDRIDPFGMPLPSDTASSWLDRQGRPVKVRVNRNSVVVTSGGGGVRTVPVDFRIGENQLGRIVYDPRWDAVVVVTDNMVVASSVGSDNVFSTQPSGDMIGKKEREYVTSLATGRGYGSGSGEKTIVVSYGGGPVVFHCDGLLGDRTLTNYATGITGYYELGINSDRPDRLIRVTRLGQVTEIPRQIALVPDIGGFFMATIADKLFWVIDGKFREITDKEIASSGLTDYSVMATGNRSVLLTAINRKSGFDNELVLVTYTGDGRSAQAVRLFDGGEGRVIPPEAGISPNSREIFSTIVFQNGDQTVIRVVFRQNQGLDRGKIQVAFFTLQDAINAKTDQKNPRYEPRFELANPESTRSINDPDFRPSQMFPCEYHDTK